MTMPLKERGRPRPPANDPPMNRHSQCPTLSFVVGYAKVQVFSLYLAPYSQAASRNH